MPKNVTQVAEAPKAAAKTRKKAAPDAPASGPKAVNTVERRNGPAAAVNKVKPNRRSEETIANILKATEEVVLMSGADRISILDVCQVAGVSRGTFYRYFSSQEDLLDTFSRHKRESFHTSLSQELGHTSDPEARLNALFAYLDNYLEQSRARRLLVVAPDYALGFFRRIFHDSIVRFQDGLGIVFDDWDDRLGVRLDRELICEMIIRYVLSEILVPEAAGRRLFPVRVKKLLGALIMGSTSRTRR
ncbi:TetR family transcriptional regulator [Pseudomonas putida]|jgi:AcrR family transcriptional regulator|uniref:TetR family transcriptional regulator n=1 Tax=Pseudomonas putida TaxID=303 RepID=A0A0P7D2I1_PSEPU|nr:MULTISPECIES: TetR/AcrR family transcriptional regulator [Pseudomonas]QPN43605.1 TetR/AcrR family transcriptional regulator [Priestia aryabhattai]EKT4541886.1 TetR/AcrR family transcriptional regulator [Pseudomonas putida]KAF4561255.1 TetR/AcrR family transcriptional regulator [Pseudomonas sp. CES]KPM62859.1 TetR family transcriptional regulator [Pseudomonas putida]NWC79280.1 TetR/AcrR family transcriptional regulator [Pseudomonas putida]